MMSKAEQKLVNSPTIAMCNWFIGDKDDPKGYFICRSQVVKLTKRSIVMRTLEGKGLVTLSGKHNGELENFTSIDQLPCDTTQWIKPDEKMKKLMEMVDNEQQSGVSSK
jgi:hypothetical protein